MPVHLINSACDYQTAPTLCPGLEAVVIDLGILRHTQERILDRSRVIEANLDMLLRAQRDANQMIALLLQGRE